jgi:hypothetical protein
MAGRVEAGFGASSIEHSYALNDIASSPPVRIGKYLFAGMWRGVRGWRVERRGIG